MDNNAKLQELINAAVQEAEKDLLSCVVTEKNDQRYFLFNYIPEERKAIWTTERTQATRFVTSLEALRFTEAHMKHKNVFIIKAPISWFGDKEELE